MTEEKNNMEQKLEITTTNKEGKEYNNITLKTKYKRNGLKLILDDDDNEIITSQGLKNGNYIIVEKVGIEGFKFEKTFPGQNKPSISYACKIMYQDKEVTFWLGGAYAEPDHKAFIEAGGMGDKIKITMNEVAKRNKATGAKFLVDTLVFEGV